jgi:hypothetical protein
MILLTRWIIIKKKVNGIKFTIHSYTQDENQAAHSFLADGGPIILQPDKCFLGFSLHNEVLL